MPNSSQDVEVIEDIRTVDSAVADIVKEFIENIDHTNRSILNAFEQEDWSFVTELVAPIKSLTRVIDSIKDCIKTLNEDAGELEKTNERYMLLSLRKKLGDNKEKVFLEARSRVLEDRLQRCIHGLDTTRVTKKHKEISQKVATESLRQSLRDEIKNLEPEGKLAAILHLEEVGKTGTTFQRLALKSKFKVREVSDVLSEGEQRIIAIASFLAELSASKHTSGIVLDDPVSSLDHEYRYKVAQRLVDEAEKRQVVIFTHDCVFLHYLAEIADDRVSLEVQEIRYGTTGYGTCIGGLHKAKMNVAWLLGEVRKTLSAADVAYKDDNFSEYEVKMNTAYSDMRSALEQCIEDCVFNGAVKRFQREVKTQSLKKVRFDAGDYGRIESMMSKFSRWMGGHYTSVAQEEPTPKPEDIRNDFKELESFYAEMKKRVN